MRQCYFLTMKAIATATIGIVALANGNELARAGDKWGWYIYNPVSTVAAVRGITKIIDTVQKQTNGALAIRLHLGGSLPINTTNITAAVSDNVVQMGDDGYFLGNVPIGGILRLPMLYRSLEEYQKAITIMGPYITSAFEKKGIVVLGQYVYPVQVVYSRRKLESLVDLKGQKLRVTSPEQSEFIKRFGGTSVTLGAPEVPTALDRGVIDGVLTASSGAGYTWKDLLKYNYRFGVSYFNSIIIVNQAAFDKLSPDIQLKLRSAVTETIPWINETMKQEEDELTQKMAAGGMVVTPSKSADISQAEDIMASYWSEWAKDRGSEAVEALRKVRAMLNR
jgi:TRAP-type transport system periplasmic protein